MVALALNGITCPVSSFSEVEPFRLGALSRGPSGQAVSTVRATKRRWRGSIIPLGREVVDAWAGLIGGRGDAWGFDATGTAYTNSARGRVAAIAANVVRNSSARMGAGSLYENGVLNGACEWLSVIPGGSPWTVFGWRIDGPLQPRAWRQYMRTSNGGLYVNGAASSTPSGFDVDVDGDVHADSREVIEGLGTWAASTAYALGARIAISKSNLVYIFQATVGGASGGIAPTWPESFNATVSDGTVTWRNDGNGGIRLDGMVALPFAVPAAWAPEIYAEHNARAWTAPPYLRATGDLVPNAPRTVVGKVVGYEPVAHMRAGALDRAGASLEFELEEA